jgi:phage repressor protein C with HTH and peptisase S24 domain
MDDIITRIKSVIADSGLTSNAFALKVGMNSSNLSRKLNGKVPITSRDYRLICDSIGVNKDWLETGTGDKYIGEPLNGKETMQPMLGVPFYDVEFALGYDEMYNDTPNVPTKFISIPGYEKADFWCRASGDSMKPLISNGDIIALKVIPDWTEFLPMNEIYAIMTKNDLRTVKVIRRGSDNEHFTLHAINEEYEDQEIKKEAITKVFKLLGALKTM